MRRLLREASRMTKTGMTDVQRVSSVLMLGTVLLAGCTDKEAELAGCKVEAAKTYANHPGANWVRNPGMEAIVHLHTVTNFIDNCMRARGYARDTGKNNCKPASDNARRAECYESVSWW